MTHILEKIQIAQGILPVDLQTAQAGDWVHFRHYNRIAAVIFIAVGTAGDDPVVDLDQAKDNAGGSAKALNFTRLHIKAAATNLLAVGQWTKVTQTDDDYTDATHAELAKMYVIDVLATDLDLANDFTHMRVSIADTGTNAQLGVMLYLGHEPRHPESPANMLTMID